MVAPHNVSVAVIDDHDVVHAGVAAWLAQSNRPVTLVGGYVTVEAYFDDHPLGSRGVDVVVIDLELHSRRLEFPVLQAVLGTGNPTIVFSHLESDEIILKCLDLGAASYVTKSEGQRHLTDAIWAAGTNTPFVAPRMAGAILRDRRVGRPHLPEREREVLIAWFQTESKDLVAEKLQIAPSTVRTHLQRIRAKYAAVGRSAPTKASLVARAIQDGLVNVDDL